MNTAVIQATYYYQIDQSGQLCRRAVGTRGFQRLTELTASETHLQQHRHTRRGLFGTWITEFKLPVECGEEGAYQKRLARQIQSPTDTWWEWIEPEPEPADAEEIRDTIQ